MKRRIFTAVIWINLLIGFAVNLLLVAGMFAPRGFWEAPRAVQSWYSPINIVILIAEAILFSPALLCLWLRSRHDERP